MNIYDMILEVCAWMRKNPSDPITKELYSCKSHDEMMEKYRKLVLKQ